MEINLTDRRNYGIDTLRLMSMLMVVILHVLGQGGVLGAVGGGQFKVAWLLEIMAYCAVDCYAIISGYVMYSKEEKAYKYSRYIRLWIQVVFYTFGITLITFIFKPDFLRPITLIRSILPVTTNQYWYFTEYTGLFFIIPWLNRLVWACSRRQMTSLVLTIFLLFSCYSTFSNFFSNTFALSGGYSFIWLTMLYLVGAWMKKFSIPDWIKMRHSIFLIVSSVIITWIFKMYIPGGSLIVSYISPTVLAMAVLYIAFFSKLGLNTVSIKLVKCFSPAAFGVYIIHCQSIVWEYSMKKRFVWIAESSVWLVPVQVIGCALGIFITCLVIEKIRLYIFKLLGIDRSVEKICDHLRRSAKEALNLYKRGDI